jgi:AraC family transcriptional regulator
MAHYPVQNSHPGEGAPAMDQFLTIEGQIATPAVTVQVRAYNPPADPDLVNSWPDYTLIRSLVPVPYSPNVGPSRFAHMGEMFLTPARVPLRYKGVGGPYRHVTCRFDRGTFEDVTGLADAWEGSALQACRSIRLPELNVALLRLAREALVPGFASELLVGGLAHCMLVDLSRYFRGLSSDARPVKGGLTPRQLRRIQDHADQATGSLLSIAEFAQICGISSGHLMRAFKQSTGQTIHAYVEQVRVAKAQRLLCETDLPIKTVAAEMGFASASSFSFAFRRATGGTPLAFRQEFRTRAAGRARVTVN